MLRCNVWTHQPLDLVFLAGLDIVVSKIVKIIIVYNVKSKTVFYYNFYNKSNKKLKLSHYTPRRRLEERKYSFYSFSTSALDGGERSKSRSGRALHPGKGPLYPLYRGLGGLQSQSGHRG
jgi:hypothetical protein